jgi:hypothetical protein
VPQLIERGKHIGSDETTTRSRLTHRPSMSKKWFHITSANRLNKRFQRSGNCLQQSCAIHCRIIWLLGTKAISKPFSSIRQVCFTEGNDVSDDLRHDNFTVND